MIPPVNLFDNVLAICLARSMVVGSVVGLERSACMLVQVWRYSELYAAVHAPQLEACYYGPTHRGQNVAIPRGIATAPL